MQLQILPFHMILIPTCMTPTTLHRWRTFFLLQRLYVNRGGLKQKQQKFQLLSAFLLMSLNISKPLVLGGNHVSMLHFMNGCLAIR